MSVTELKGSIADLQSSSSALIDLLARVRDEGRTIDPSGKEVNWQWVEQALANIRAYDQKLAEVLQARDPRLIHYAASNFISMRKYFLDTPLEWSKLKKNLADQVSETVARAGKVAFAINPFDASGLAEIQRSL